MTSTSVERANGGDKPWTPKNSWMKFYPVDFIGSSNVQMMGLEERGAFITLLCASWQLDGLDDQQIRKLLGSRYEDLWPGVEPCWRREEDGRWRNARQEIERAEAIKRVQKASAGGRARRDSCLSPARAAAKQCLEPAVSGLRSQVVVSNPSQSLPWREGVKVCFYCGVRASEIGKALQADHFVPRSAGGSQVPGNVVLACYACNNIKGDRIFETFQEARQHIHWTLWVARRRRYARLRSLCFGGREPTGERPRTLRYTGRRRMRRVRVRDIYNSPLCWPDGRERWEYVEA